MIHQLLTLTRPLICTDVETTGLNPESDRIIEVGFQRWSSLGMTKEWRSLVNPGVPIPEAVTKIHGITDETVTGCRACDRPLAMHRGNSMLPGVPTRACEGFKPWPTFKDLAPNLAKGFTDVDYAGKQIKFDLRFLAAEFKRAGVAWSTVGARIIDADRLEQLGEPRHLSNLVKKHLNEDMGSDAHTALGDVKWTSRLIEAQLRKYQMLPHDLDLLHAAQWPGQIDVDGKFRFVDGVPCFTGWGKYRGRPMRDADAGYWDFVIAKDFPEDVKQLARNAKLGMFPEEKK